MNKCASKTRSTRNRHLRWFVSSLESRTMRDRRTSFARSLVRRLLCKAPFFFDTRVGDLLSLTSPLHFPIMQRLGREYLILRDDTGIKTHLMSAMVNRRISVQIMPRVSFKLPSMISATEVVCYQKLRQVNKYIPSGPMLVSFTPLEVMNSRALLTFSAF